MKKFAGLLLLFAFDVGNHVALVHVRALLSVDLNEQTTESSGQFVNLAIVVFDVAEELTSLVLLADERLDALDAFAIAADFP